MSGLNQQATKQAALLRMSRLALQGGDLKVFLAEAVEIVAEGLGADLGGILEYLPEEDAFTRISDHDPGPVRRPNRFPASPELHATRTYRADRPVYVTDFDEQPEQRNEWLAARGIRSSLACAVGGPLRAFGVIGMHFLEPRTFSDDDIDFVDLAAGILSIAVERKQSEDQRRLLLGRLVSAQEQERKRIAGEIHDDAVQVMTAANLRLEMFRRLLTDPDQLAAADRLQETVSLSIGRLRNLLFELAPPGLEGNGLGSAIRLQLDRLQADSGVLWALRDELPAGNSVEVRTVLFRIFQEALTNIRKHARATAIAVELTAVDGGVQMSVTDDGRGFAIAHSSTPVSGHLGLASMRERADMAGGWWRIQSAPGEGTKVTAWLPASRTEPGPAPR